MSEGRKMVLCLSGGGFRATLFHLGVIRALQELGRLRTVTHITSVSGGSVLGAHLLLNWDTYTNSQTFATAAERLICLVRKDLRGSLLRQWLCFWLLGVVFTLVPPTLLLTRWGVGNANIWLAAGWVLVLLLAVLYMHTYWSRTSLLQRKYGRLFDRKRLQSLGGESKPSLHILCTSLSSGECCSFNGEGFQVISRDHVQHIRQERLPVALAVAASSAFPPAFPPIALTSRLLGCTGEVLPNTQYLTDGGVFDNLGVHPVALLFAMEETDEVIVSNAEQRFEFLDHSFALTVPRALRSTSILMQRLSDTTVEQSASGGMRRCRHIALSQDDPPAGSLPTIVHNRLKTLRTDLDRFSVLECQTLFFLGYEKTLVSFGTPTDEVCRRFTFNSHGIPVETLKDSWLPFRSTESELGEDPEKALTRSHHRPILASLVARDVPTVAMAAVLLGLAFLLFWFYSRVAPAEQAIDFAYKGTRGTVWDGIDPNKDWPWLMEIGHPGRGQPGMAVTYRVGLYTGDRRFDGFRLVVKPAHSAGGIRCASAFLVKAQDRSLLTLKTIGSSSKCWEFMVPGGHAEDFVVVVYFVEGPGNAGDVSARISRTD